ncbi:sensor histidine kinase [Sunxiuqinia sp. A32]|uniref:sensor histidine kinase n=1 Tax=Sunxiuqinia sp. A32 TaxID=3461496 RepID=UPI00404536B5
MKQQNLLIFFVLGFLFLSTKLSAVPPEGRFGLEVGDWFEMKFDLPLSFRSGCTSPLDFFKDSGGATFTVFLRYQLQNQRSNGNQLFNVSIKRVQSKLLGSEGWMGYDSYYPPYQDDNNAAKEFIQFEMEVTPDGIVSRFDSISGCFPSFNHSKISPDNNHRVRSSYSLNLPTKSIELFSNFVAFLPPKSGFKTLLENKIETNNYSETEFYGVYEIRSNDSISVEIKCLKKERILVADQMCHLENASFRIPANTLIKGELTDQANQEITISLDGDDKEFYFKKATFKTDEDGSFICPIFLNRSFYLNIEIGNKKLSAFVEPKDTLEILAISQKVERVSYRGAFHDCPTSPGYLLGSANFKGNAAFNAELSVEMDEWMTNYLIVPKDLQAYQEYRNVMVQKVNELINHYRRKASETCIDYFKTKWDYYLAYSKLALPEKIETKFIADKSGSFQKFVKVNIDYPDDFFLECDTLATLMVNDPWCKHYKAYLEEAYKFRKNRLGMAVGGLDNDFYANYYFSRASLKGFPLYSALAKAIDLELRSGFASASEVEPFYQDFMNNCKDPLLTEPLAKVHETVAKLATGETFPVQSFLQQDSTIFDLSTHKGKPVCLVILDAPRGNINNFKKNIEKFEPDQIDFVFVVMPRNWITQDPVDSTILALPNVKVIDVTEKDLKRQVLLSSGSKIFLLDKWLRIVDDEAKDPNNYFGSKSLENAIRKAILAKRYSKEEKAAMYKNAGWSLGSILFTFLAGLWVYRIRIRRLKRKEAAKRRIKELEIKAIRSQMNPHFIFNALNSIQSLVNSNQFKETNIYLSKFSVLLRSVLSNSERNMVTLSDELEAVRLYCELEQLRFEFELTIKVSPQINSDLIEIPGMIIQPLVENAVVHGLSPIRENGRLMIDVTQCDDSICVYVIDNGVGLSKQKEDKLSQKGFGLKLVEERLAILSHRNKQAKLTIVNNGGGSGTKATLIIPID